MKNKDLIRNRHVNGLRLACTVGAGLNFTGILVSILTNLGWESELAGQLFMFGGTNLCMVYIQLKKLGELI